MNYAKKNEAKAIAQQLVYLIHNVDPSCPDRLKHVRQVYRQLGKVIASIDPKGVKQ